MAVALPDKPLIQIRPRCTPNTMEFWWFAPSSGGPVDNYILSCSDASISNTYSNTTLYVKLSGLTNGVDYTFQLVAMNYFGNSSPAIFRTSQPGHISSAPSNVSVALLNNYPRVTWQNPTIASDAKPIWNVVTAVPINSSAEIVKESTYGYKEDMGISGLDTTQTYNFLVQGVASTGYSPKSAWSGTLSFQNNPYTLSGLELWLDASDISTLFSDVGATNLLNLDYLVPPNPANVSCWLDKSSNQKQFSTVKPDSSLSLAPVWSTNSFNSTYPSLAFHVNGQQLFGNNIQITTGLGATFFIVGKINTDIQQNIVTNTTESFSVSEGSGNISIGLDGTSTNYTFGTEPFIYTFYTDGTNVYTYQSQPSVSIPVQTGVINSTVNQLMNVILGNTNAQNFNLCEIIAYNRSLNSTERVNIENYLTYKWGFTLLPYVLTKPRNWFDICQDGNGGEAGRVYGTMNNYISCNVYLDESDRTTLSALYLDTVHNQIRYMYGRSPDANLQNLYSFADSLSPLTNFVGYTSSAQFSTWYGFSTNNDTLWFVSNNPSVTTQLALSSINSTVSNVKLQKCITANSQLILIALGNGIYVVSFDGSGNLSTATLVSDYTGESFSIYSDDTLLLSYLAYTAGANIKVVSFPYNSTTTSLIGTFNNTDVVYANPTIVVNNNVPLLFISNSSNIVFSTIVNQDTSISVGSSLIYTTSYKLLSIGGTVYLIGLDINNKLFEVIVSNGSILAEININVGNKIVSGQAFDVCNINDEQYIFYCDTNGQMRQLWNPINSIDITVNQVISGLNASVSGAGNLTPDFAVDVTDYGMMTDGMYNTIEYTLVVNGSLSIVDVAYPNQLISITDLSNNHYYIRLHPNHTIYGSGIVKNAGYVPGYYLTVDTFGSGSPYYSIYDSNGIPVWYRRSNSDPSYENNPQLTSLQLGASTNRVCTLIFDGYRPRSIIDISTLEEENFLMLANTRNSVVPGADVHETIEIKGPGNRRGNCMLISYYSGWYLQEISPQHQIVWEAFSSDYFNDDISEDFHLNAVDVHPKTGNVILSFRTQSAVICINYVTKNMDWAIDSNGSLVNITKNPSLTKFLTISGEPVLGGEQYHGVSAQHDCRWHPDLVPLTAGNEIVSIFDDESFNGRPYARGVVYEIDFVNSICLWRGNVYTTVGGESGYMGSYRIKQEANGSTSHVLDWVQQHPSCVEYAGDQYGMPTQNELFKMDFPGDHYRIDKATPADLDIVAMRRTAGMPYSTP